MKKFAITLIIFCLALITRASDNDSIKDDNTAIYEGEDYTYVISPPAGFKMISEPATFDGYSFAFIPVTDEYDSASVIIGANIYKLKKSKRQNFDLEDLIHQDTLLLRKHYGSQVAINEVKPIVSGSNDSLRTIYINDPEEFIPNVMIAYQFNGFEVLIFELVIDSDYPRFRAEKEFVKCLENMKALKNGSIGVG